MFQQFLALLNALEDGENKTNLITAFSKIQEDSQNAYTQRDTAKAENAPLKELVESLKGASGLDNLDANSLKELISSKSKGGAEVDTLNASLEELRNKYTDLETTHNGFVTESKEKSFELAISQSDIFKDVSSDPFLRNAVLASVKDKLAVGEDGKLYAKNSDGSIMEDLVSGEKITGQHLFSQMIESGAISKSALNGTVGQGAGGQGNNGGGSFNSDKKLKDMSEKDKGALIKEIGNDEYLKRVNSELQTKNIGA